MLTVATKNKKQTLGNRLLSVINSLKLHQRDESVFGELALELFEKQYAENPTYRALCDQKKLSPEVVTAWSEIPAVTTSAFKFSRLACFPKSDDEIYFQTSGTTQQISGRHYFRTLDFYRAAALRSFKAYCLPERDKIRMLIVGPSAEGFPRSSLGFMFSEACKTFGTIKNGVYFSSDGLKTETLINDLHAAVEDDEPVFVLGTSLALLEFTNIARNRELSFDLPKGSRLLDTGGYKGRDIEITRDEFLDRLIECFNLPLASMINEYGMTELSSQFYESRLPGTPLADERTSIKFSPPWTRVVAVDPATLEILPDGETGMLRIFDLANIDSVIAIQTEDLGRAWPDRMELLRRATGAELRGCSLLTESILRMD